MSDESTSRRDAYNKAHSYPSLKCSDIGYPECPHIAYGASEEALFRNAKYHAVNKHAYTEESWEKELLEKIEEYRKLIKLSPGEQ
jgi:predicted small metal-binding protein